MFGHNMANGHGVTNTRTRLLGLVDDDGSATEAFADVVVGVAFQLKGDAWRASLSCVGCRRGGTAQTLHRADWSLKT